jgi:hypothetical protein
MDKIVYALCALTCLTCAVLLLKGYARSGLRLLLWSGLCFVILTGTNTLLFVDVVLLPAHDLVAVRHGITLMGLLILLYGLIWES